MSIFTFASRAVKIQFFEDDPVVITVFIGDEFDKKLVESAKLINAADKVADLDERREKYMDSLRKLIGASADEIMSRAEPADSFAIMSVYMHISTAYAEAKRKNLSASVSR